MSLLNAGSVERWPNDPGVGTSEAAVKRRSIVLGGLAVALLIGSAAVWTLGTKRTRRAPDASSWVSVDKSPGLTRTLVDPKSIRVEGAIRHGVAKIVLPPHRQRGSGEYANKWIDSIIYEFAFDCLQSKSRVEGSGMYFDDGTSYVDPKSNYPKPWQAIPSGFQSNWEKIREFVCAWRQGDH
jgi:hypothetical protein